MKTPIVRLERVSFEDYAVLLRRVADWIDQTVRVGTDEAEQLRSAANMMVNLALASRERVQ